MSYNSDRSEFAAIRFFPDGVAIDDDTARMDGGVVSKAAGKRGRRP